MILPIRSQTIVITGASSGIGRETALLLARRGARLVLAARDVDSLESVAREIRAFGGEAVVAPCDVSEARDLERVADVALATYGRIDTWINNAGVSEYSLIERMSHSEIEQIVRVNLLGVIHGSRAAVRVLRNQFDGGAVINIGSVLSIRSVPLQGIYSATKHAVKGFTESLRMEMMHQNLPVRVVLVMPGSVDTPFYRSARSRTGRRPQPTPPVYDPMVVAETIAFAAANPSRDLYAGGMGLGLALGQILMPSLLDKYMVTRLFDDQLSDTPDDGRSNLFLSTSTPKGSRGGYTGRSFSLATRLQNLPSGKKNALSGLILALVAGVTYLGWKNNPPDN